MKLDFLDELRKLFGGGGGGDEAKKLMPELPQQQAQSGFVDPRSQGGTPVPGVMYAAGGAGGGMPGGRDMSYRYGRDDMPSLQPIENFNPSAPDNGGLMPMLENNGQNQTEQMPAIGGMDTAAIHGQDPYLSRPLATSPVVDGRPRMAVPEFSDSNPAGMQLPRPRMVTGNPVDVTAQVTVPPAAEAQPPLMPVLTPSQQKQGEIDAIYAKDYSKARPAEYDANGVEITPAKPRGKDRDKKWSLGEKVWSGVRGFAEGMGSGGIVGGIVNAGIKGSDRNASEKWDDQTKLMKLLPEQAQMRKQEQFDQEQGVKGQQAANYQNEILNRDRKARQESVDAYVKQLNEQQKQIWDEYKFTYDNQPAFDPALPENAERVSRFKSIGQPVPTKPAGEGWEVSPNGQMFDKFTGKVKEGVNFARPRSISSGELPDELFGIQPENSISDRARAEVGALPVERRLRADVANRLPYKKPDGSFDEDAYWSAANSDRERDRPAVRPGDLYENLPSNYEQRLATTRERIRKSQAGLSTEAARFKSSLTTYSPRAEAKAVPLTEIIHVWRKIMGIDPPDQGEKLPAPKDRPAKLKAFYEALPNYRVQ